jgi:phage baseplate assembly protein W
MPTYSDINLYVTRYTSKELAEDYASIDQNIFLIVLTPLGSKWRKPRLGTNIIAYLFEPMDEVTTDKIRAEIKGLFIRNAEPRITVTNVTVTPDYENQNYIVSITYIAVQIGDKPYTLRFGLNLQVA